MNAELPGVSEAPETEREIRFQRERDDALSTLHRRNRELERAESRIDNLIQALLNATDAAS